MVMFADTLKAYLDQVWCAFPIGDRFQNEFNSSSAIVISHDKKLKHQTAPWDEIEKNPDAYVSRECLPEFLPNLTRPSAMTLF